MGIAAKNDFISELNFWTDDALKEVVQEALAKMEIQEMFAEKQVKVIAWISSYIATKLLVSYNDMDVTYRDMPTETQKVAPTSDP
jgi:hypothetical protein